MDPAEHLDVAADLMRLGRLRHSPVMSGGRLVGMVTQRDLLHVLSPSVVALERDAERNWMAGIAVSDHGDGGRDAGRGGSAKPGRG